MMNWLARIWNDNRHDNELPRTIPATRHDPDAEFAELAAMIEGGDINEAKLERMAELLGQTDSNRSRF